jgi:hypothetical protein
MQLGRIGFPFSVMAVLVTAIYVGQREKGQDVDGRDSARPGRTGQRDQNQDHLAPIQTLGTEVASIAHGQSVTSAI